MGDELGLPVGFKLRAPGWEDLEAVLELIRTCEEEDEGEAESMADDLRTDWRLPGVDLGRDAWVAVTPKERTVGYASIWRVKGQRFESDGYTHPEFRGQGIGTRLVRAVEARAKEALRAGSSTGSQPAQGERKNGATLRSPVNHANESARRLLENEGYAPRRYYWRMVIGLESPPPAPDWPDGVTIRAFEPGQDDHAVHALVQEAFADNHDYAQLPFEAWRAAMIEREDFDPSLFLLATAGDEIVGAALCPRYEKMGCVRQLVVRRDRRRSGIARGLLREAFGEFYRRGQRSAGLVVDSFPHGREGAL